MNYQQHITTAEKALCHLFFHCCYKDGTFTNPEIKQVSDKIVAAGLHVALQLKEEIIQYEAYKFEIGDEEEYLRYLINLIKPINSLALFSYCVELCLTDTASNIKEDAFLNRLSSVLNLTEGEKTTIEKLIAQRRIVEKRNVF